MKLPKVNLSKAKFLLDKHSPEIWLGAGIVCIIGGTIWACKASRKLDAIMDYNETGRLTLKENLEDAIEAAKEDYIDCHSVEENEIIPVTDDMVALQKAYKKDCARLTLETAACLVKEYAPAVILIAGGIGMIINGHRILCKRNATILAAYTALDQAFTDYRGRVKDRYGEEVENEIYTGVTYVDTVKSITDEDGKKKKVKEKVPVVGTSVSPYARFYDESNSTEWTRSPDYNHTFIICQQNNANDKLRRKGFLFLNDVYRMLGLSETSTGAICGWILPGNADECREGDNFIEFKIFDGSGPDILEMTDGYAKDILLDFNCQGIIYDKI